MFSRILAALKDAGIIRENPTFLSWFRSFFFGQDNITFQGDYGFQSQMGGIYENTTGESEYPGSIPLAGNTLYGHSDIFLGAAEIGQTDALGPDNVGAGGIMEFTILHEYAHLIGYADESSADNWARLHMTGN